MCFIYPVAIDYGQSKSPEMMRFLVVNFWVGSSGLAFNSDVR